MGMDGLYSRQAGRGERGAVVIGLVWGLKSRPNSSLSVPLLLYSSLLFPYEGSNNNTFAAAEGSGKTNDETSVMLFAFSSPSFRLAPED